MPTLTVPLSPTVSTTDLASLPSSFRKASEAFAAAAGTNRARTAIQIRSFMVVFLSLGDIHGGAAQAVGDDLHQRAAVDGLPLQPSDYAAGLGQHVQA